MQYMKLKLYTVGCMMAAALTSCNDYLKEDSGDLLIPQNVTEFQSVLFGEGYPRELADEVAFLDLMTDDVTCMDGLSDDPADGYDSNSIPTGRGAYLWAYDLEAYIEDVGDVYTSRYQNILACNIVIENEATMEGLETERDFIVAQAYTLRAYSYFYLVNLYGLPYNKETADTDMGVAIRLDSEVTREQFARSTVQQVYDQIYSDLEHALALFETAKESSNKYLVSKKAAQLLMTRVALFTEDWDKVIQYGEEMYNDGITLFNMSGMTAADLNQNNPTSFSFISPDNNEIIFSFGGPGVGFYQVHKYIYMNAAEYAGPVFTTSQDPDDPNALWNIYEEGDNRKYAFFRQDDVEEFWGMVFGTYYLHIPNKHNYSNGDTEQRFAFRYAELLLNLAEAYVQKGGSDNLSKAVDMLNELREARYTTESYQALTTADFATSEELLDFARLERRRELCFDESHRWMDLRRQGMPRIEHKFHASVGAPDQTYVLEERDRNYTLALPSSETGYNTVIEQYGRRDIQPQ